jgi:hypothetical protein
MGISSPMNKLSGLDNEIGVAESTFKHLGNSGHLVL